MSEAFLGEIRPFGFNFAPVNWAVCDGSLMSIPQNTALFSILGTNFGGNGKTTFGLPDLRFRVGVGAGQGPGLSSYSVGEDGGEAVVPIDNSTSPAHSHGFLSAGVRYLAVSNTPMPDINPPNPPVAKSLAKASGCNPYTPPNSPPKVVALAPQALSVSGGSATPQPHNNVMPCLAVNYCICTNGIFPQRP
jgi:microcystin-dependent protein